MADRIIDDYLEAFHASNPLCKADMVPLVEKDDEGLYVVTIGWPTRFTEKQMETFTERLRLKVDNPDQKD